MIQSYTIQGNRSWSICLLNNWGLPVGCIRCTRWRQMNLKRTMMVFGWVFEGFLMCFLNCFFFCVGGGFERLPTQERVHFFCTVIVTVTSLKAISLRCNNQWTHSMPLHWSAPFTHEQPKDFHTTSNTAKRPRSNKTQQIQTTTVGKTPVSSNQILPFNK